MEIIPYNSNYTLFYQVFFSPSFLSGKSKIVQNYSISAKLEQGQKFLFLNKRWRNQTISGQRAGERFPEHPPGPQEMTHNQVGFGFQCLGHSWKTKWSRRIKTLLGDTPPWNFSGVNKHQWWKGFYWGYYTEIQHSLNFCTHKDKCNCGQG